MKRWMQTVKTRFLFAASVACIVILAIIITLICIFTIKPNARNSPYKYRTFYTAIYRS